LDARLTGFSISQLSENDLRIASDKIIIRCSVLTGCEMPFTEFYAAALTEQILEIFVKFGFDKLTLAEILLAMEMNWMKYVQLPSGDYADEIRFEGKTVNVSFITKVLYKYMMIRNFLDRKLENHIDGY